MACAKPHFSTSAKCLNGNQSINSNESIDKIFNKWNPMEDDYKNSDFNKFTDGPGADLDDDLQPGAIAAAATNKSYQQQNNERQNKYRLILKNVPKDMTKMGVRNLCSNYGKVVQIWESPKAPFKFVTFASLNDMSRALTALSSNPYGIIVEIAKDRNTTNTNTSIKPQIKTANSGSSLSDQSGEENKMPSNVPDMSRRSILGPFTKPPRPANIQNVPFVTETIYNNSDLKIVDPNKNFLTRYDMHYQDRNNKDETKNDDKKYGKNVHTGRSYYIESKEKMQHLKKLSESSEGTYNEKQNCYQKISPKSDASDLISKKCSKCLKWANKICERCHTYYCSLECQRSDWQQHRSYCVINNKKISKINKPLLENIEEIIDQLYSGKSKNLLTCNDNIKETQEMINKYSNLPENEINESNIKMNKKNNAISIARLPKSGSHISITSVTQPNLFYIRSLNSEDNVEYVKILNIVNNLSVNARQLKDLPRNGDICVTNFQNTGYYRALILNSIDKNQIIVIYIDFGNIEEKKLCELKEATDEIKNLKCYTRSVNLKNVPNFVPTQRVKDYLNSFVDSVDVELKLIYDDDDDENDEQNVEVEIINVTNNESLNKKIIELKNIQEPKESDAPVFKVDIEHKLLQEGENVEVFVLDNSLLQLGCISCILQKNMLPLQEFNEQLKEYAEKASGPYTPRQTELCIVKYDDDQWYRAECLEVVGDENPAVIFIDYGNMSPIHINNIRRYPKEFKYHPCKTSCCMIADLPENIDEKLANRLQELIPMNKMLTIAKISSDTMDDETNIIYLPEVINKLKIENFITDN